MSACGLPEHSEEALQCWSCGGSVPLNSRSSPLHWCGVCSAISRPQHHLQQHRHKRRLGSGGSGGSGGGCGSGVMWLAPLLFTVALVAVITVAGLWALPVVLDAARAGSAARFVHTVVAVPVFVACVLWNYGVCVFADPGRVAVVPLPHGRRYVDVMPDVKDHMMCVKCDPARPRPPGALHCSTCRACTVGHDHHCWFTGRCVGGGTRAAFLKFLGAVVAASVYIQVMVAWALLATLHYDGLRAVGASKPSPSRGSLLMPLMFLTPLSVALFVAVGWMLVQQMVSLAVSTPTLLLAADDYEVLTTRGGLWAAMQHLKRGLGAYWWLPVAWPGAPPPQPTRKRQ